MVVLALAVACLLRVLAKRSSERFCGQDLEFTKVAHTERSRNDDKRVTKYICYVWCCLSSFVPQLVAG
jgi:hypothetical protein